MQRIWPRERAGLSMLAASTAPTAPPAPRSMCSSSMKTITLPSLMISATTPLRRSSKSPRYLVPATIPGRSSCTRRTLCSMSGTSLLTMAWARPSTMAVLPTPASPTRTGLFFVRRRRIWAIRCSSFSRPTRGSVRPTRASWVRSRPNWVSREGLPSPLPSPRPRQRDPPGPLAGPRLAAGLGEPGGLPAHDVRVDPQLLQHPPGQAVPLGQDAQQEVLRADVLRPQALRLQPGHLDRAPGGQGEGDPPGVHGAPDVQVGDHLPHHRLGVDPLPAQEARGHRLRHGRDGQQDVLGADLVVLEEGRLLLGQGQDLAARSPRDDSARPCPSGCPTGL